MKLTFKFFDILEWSIYGTICVLIPFLLLIIFKIPLTSENLIFASLIGMMQGEILPRILFTGFLNFLVYKPRFEWIIQSCIFVLSCILTYYIPFNVHKVISQNHILTLFFKVAIFLWMIYIFYLLWKRD